MNLGEIIIRVQRQFGDETEAQITRADIIRWANDAQMDIVRRVEALQQHAETNSQEGVPSYSLPTDFIKLRRVTFEGQRLEQTTLEELDLIYPNRQGNPPTGKPEFYYVWGDDLWIYPVPSSAGVGVLDIYYLREPKILANDVDIPDIASFMHEDIVRYCVARAKELDEESTDAQRAMDDYNLRIAQSRSDNLNVDFDSYPAVRALPGDDW